MANVLTQQGYRVTGVDASAQGIERAHRRYPHLNLHSGFAHDSLVDLYGQYPVVVSLEVIEHVYAPKDFARTMFDLVEPSGTAIISTPYHGYWKNLALARLAVLTNTSLRYGITATSNFGPWIPCQFCSGKPGSGLSRSSAWVGYPL